jgi:hypothetical protein
MIRYFLKRQLLKNKDLFFQEAQKMSGFLALLMKERNTGGKWTEEEKKEIKSYLKRLAWYLPVLVVFLLPGGLFLLPFLAEVMDRRRARRVRLEQAQDAPGADPPEGKDSL